MPPRIVDKQARRAGIIEAATTVFAGHGYKGASVDDIAEAAGVSKGTVYGYFHNKEDLFYASFEAFQAQVAEQFMTALTEQPTARGSLAVGLKTITAMLRANIDVFPVTLEVWAAASSGPTRERFAAAMEGLYVEFRGLTTGLIQRGQEEGEFRRDVNAEAVAGWLVGGLDGLMLQCWFDPEIDVAVWAEDFLQVILRGISVDTVQGETS